MILKIFHLRKMVGFRDVIKWAERGPIFVPYGDSNIDSHWRGYLPSLPKGVFPLTDETQPPYYIFTFDYSTTFPCPCCLITLTCNNKKISSIFLIEDQAFDVLENMYDSGVYIYSEKLTF